MANREDNDENDNHDLDEYQEMDEDVPNMAMMAYFRDRDMAQGMDLDQQDDEEVEDEDIEDDEEEIDVSDEEREAFNMEATTSHQYLHAEDEIDCKLGEYWIEGSESVQVPVLRQDIVCLPGQVVPIHTTSPSDRQAVRMALDNKTYIALQTCFQSHGHGQFFNEVINENDNSHGKIGTLLAPRQTNDDGLVIKAIMVGRQRCRFLKFETTITGALIATVEVVPERIMAPLLNTVCPNSSLKFSADKKRKLAQAIGGISLIAAEIVSLESNCKQLANWMMLWYSENQIKTTLEQGAENFSFWVAMNIPISLKDKYEYLEQDCTDLRIMTLLKMIQTLTEIVCVHCQQKISKMNKIIKMSVDSTNGHFVNNHGFIHEMLTVSEVQNIEHRGIPTAEYSWFPGYKWQISQCNNCHHHLGWEFTSKRLKPAKFYGLTRSGIAPLSENSEVSTPERNTLVDAVLRMIQRVPRIENVLL